MRTWIRDRSIKKLRPGSPEFFKAQKALLLSRPLVKRCYDDWYARLLRDADSVPKPGVLLELGSGGSYLKDLRPSIVSSDVVENVADRVIDGRKLPFPADSLQGIFLTHVFHHIPEIDAFFQEAARTLVPGGVISMIEVAHTPFARFFFGNCHHEPYDDKCREWSFAQQDSMMDCNQALSWMIFVRDRAEFERRYPTLQIESLTLIPWFTYFTSGGVTSPYLIPNFMNGFMIGLENLLQPLNPVFSLHWHIRLRKK